MLEDDIILDKDWLEEVCDILNSTPREVACVFSSFSAPRSKSYEKRGGLIGLLSRIPNYFNLDNTFIPKNSGSKYGLVEVPTIPITCAAFSRRPLFDVGLYTEALEEPFKSDDYELGFRLYKKGYTILKTDKVEAVHLTPYGPRRETKEPAFFEKFLKSEMFFNSKHWDLLGYHNFSHLIYMLAYSLAKTFRSRDLLTFPKSVRGILSGFIEGYRYYKSEED